MCRITHGLLQRESRGQEIYFQGLKNIPPCTRFPRWRCWWLGSCAQAILRWSAGSPPGPLSWTPHMSPPRAHAPVLGGCRRGRLSPWEALGWAPGPQAVHWQPCSTAVGSLQGRAGNNGGPSHLFINVSYCQENCTNRNPFHTHSGFFLFTSERRGNTAGLSSRGLGRSAALAPAAAC